MFIQPSISKGIALRIAPASLGLILALGFVPPVLAQIVPNGAGTVVNPQGNQINITGGTQAGANLFLSFRDFNLTSSQIANFLSNPQIQNILARVNGGNPSVINGLLQVTGGNSNLFLMNPSGIIFGANARLNVPASFTATTANSIGFGNNNLFNAFGDNNFSALIGNPDSFLFTTTQPGSIVNTGNLAVSNGQNLSLIAGNTINTGKLTAPGGEIQVLAVPGTDRVRLSQPGQVLSLEFIPPVNSEIRAVDLPALLTGSNLTGIQVSETGQVQVAGTNLPNQQGLAVASGRIDVSSATGNGGTVQVLGDRVAALNSRINANGATGGGTVRLGGEYLGGRDTGIAPALRFNSQRTLVDRNSLIRANATVTGEGGRVIVWADQNTGYFGRITGRGATGRGGFVEVSGRENLAFDGRVEIQGANGLFGTLLLDPTNITIQAAVGVDDTEVFDGIILSGDVGVIPPDMTISAGALFALLSSTTVDIQATNNINFNVPVTFAACTAGTCGGISFRAGGAFNTNGNDIQAVGRNLSITAASISAGGIDASSFTPSRDGGSITLTANSGNITAGNISSGASTLTGNAGAGRDINISAPNGNVVVTGNVDSRSVAGSGTGNSSNAGNITITAQSVTTGIVAAYSRVDTGAFGNGGDITIRATNGGVTASGITTAIGAAGAGSPALGIAGDIIIDASSDITISGAIISPISPNPISLDTRSDARGGGNAGTGGNIRINQSFGGSGNFLASGQINSFSSTAVTGNSSNAGNITITAQSVTTGIIAAYSKVDTGTSGNGGNITIRATNGGVTVSGITTATGAAGARTPNPGRSGVITIDATNDVTLSGAIIPEVSPNLISLDTRSDSRAGGNAGTGGNIRINQSFGGSGNFRADGEINSFSSAVSVISSSARAGDITIAARNINTNTINSYSLGGSFSGDGGSINISSQGYFSTAGSIDSTSLGIINSSGRGGDINISSQSYLSTTGYISSTSQSSVTAGRSGDITLSSQGDLSTNDINSFSFGAINSFGNGGSITLSSQGNLSTNGINSFSGGGTTSGNGGSINISSQGNLSTGDILSTSTNFFGLNSGNGGDINISSQSDLFTSFIFSESTGSGGSGGNISIYVRNLFLTSGSTSARDGITNATISTQGGLGGGSINITHGGSTSVPFLVGGATNNGTSDAITRGSGADTINNLVVPVPPADNFYGTSNTIRISTQAPPPLSTPFVPPASSLSPVLVSLLTNPSPPPTPAPVVVGTLPLPPELTPETPLILATTIAAQPPAPITPLLPLPSPNIPSIPTPSSINPQLTRPNLDASPLLHAPLTLAVANSNFSIIDKISIDYLGNDIRLLDQPFKEEFQAFTGLADEIATLDVNQAQDILKRLQNETNTKSVLIYVFFSSENEAEQNARNTSTTRAQLNRTPSSTDILQVVLVPPTGDLIRVKHPNLRRPDVVNAAQFFTRIVINQNPGYIRSSKQIYSWIVAPLEDELKRLKIDNLVFLMDSGLRSMPIAALKNDKDKFIIEDYSVGLMPSLSLTNTSYVSMRNSQVFGMGADRFTASGLNNLPAVPVELNTINQITGGSTFLNENFTLSNLRQARRPQQRIVHLATHGSFTSGDKSNSYIQLWGSERITLDQIRQAGWGSPPVDFLVLSACQTALGDREAELGFAGLAVQTGVRSALASLWQVSDPGTLGLMAEFYQRLQTTTTKAEALRQAQLAMLRGKVRLEGGNLVTPQGNFPLSQELEDLGNKPLEHPFFWSAFALVGNPW